MESRTRTRTVTTPASNGGLACPVLEETETRLVVLPPVDCVVSLWSEFGPWTPIIGSNPPMESRTRTRTVVTQPANGGLACPVLEETETRLAPVDCSASAWSEWSAWTFVVPVTTPTTESRYRTRTVVTQPENGGLSCPNLTENESRLWVAPAPPLFPSACLVREVSVGVYIAVCP